MKKTLGKKLALSKTTVADLSKKELNEVRGGAISFCCWTGDDCTFGCTGGGSSRAVWNCVTGLCSELPECQ